MLSNKPKNNWYIQISKINSILLKKKKKKLFLILDFRNQMLPKSQLTNDQNKDN